jgi:hypothetical protein
MVGATPLAAVIAACCLCAPAQADVLPIKPPSASVPAAAKVVSSAQPAVGQIATRAAAPTPPDVTIPDAAAAKPAVQAAVTTTTAQVAQGRAGDSGALRVGASSLRRVPSARLRRPVAPREVSGQSRNAQPAPRSTERPPVLLRDAPANGATASHPATAGPERDGPPVPQPGPHAEGGVSSGAAGLFAGGAAMLTGALILVAPRLRRRLLIDPAVLRPVAFVALLERPG